MRFPFPTTLKTIFHTFVVQFATSQFFHYSYLWGHAFNPGLNNWSDKCNKSLFVGQSLIRNNCTVDVGRHLLKLFSPNSLLNNGQLDQAVQDTVQSGFEYPATVLGLTLIQWLWRLWIHESFCIQENTHYYENGLAQPPPHSLLWPPVQSFWWVQQQQNQGHSVSKEIIMLGSARIPFDSLPGKFIMQVQELCADTGRGWKHTSGRVREDQTILSERQMEDDPDLHLSVIQLLNQLSRLTKPYS